MKNYCDVDVLNRPIPFANKKGFYKYKRFYYASFFFVIFLPFLSLAQQQVEFTHLTNAQGLSQSSVYAFLKDKYGFMWVGTGDGLNKYDGYKFKVYRNDPKKKNSLHSGSIQTIYEDRQGNLWIGTNGGGLSLFDRNNDAFINFEADENDAHALSTASVNSVYEDIQNNFWVGTFRGLNLMNRKNGRTTQFHSREGDSSSLSGENISFIKNDSKGNLWVGTTSGLNLFDYKTKTFKRFLHDAKNKNSISSNEVRSFVEDNQGNLWFGTNGGGLNLFNAQSQIFTAIQHNANLATSISSDIIYEMAASGKNGIWIGTELGLNYMDIHSRKFIRFLNRPNDESSLGTNSARAVYLDENKILWVGTFDGGISKYDRNLSHFKVHKSRGLEKGSLSFKVVTSFAEQPGGSIWVGTDGGGLNILDKKTNQFEHFRHDPTSKKSISSNSILTVLQSKVSRYVWAGTYGAGLNRLDPVTGFAKRYYFGEDPKNANNVAVYALMEDRKGNIWIGTNGGGLNVLEAGTENLIKYKKDTASSKSVSSDENWRLCYFIGGGMGLALLFLRVRVLESTMYEAAKDAKVQLGNFFMFLNNKERFLRYLRAITIGLPVWFVIGILISFSDEFAKEFGIAGFDQPRALMLQYVALAFGDMGAGILSNYIKSRKKALLIFYGILSFFIFLFFALKGGGSAFNMYLLCMGLGFGSGISVLYITMSAEQFGTNLRASAAISIPNLVRGFLPLILLLFKFLRSDTVVGSYVTAAWITGVIVMLTGFISVLYTKETFGKELNFVEK